MTITKYLRVVKERWRLVLAVFFGTVGLALLVTSLMPAQYESSISLYISTRGASDNTQAAYQGGLLSEQRVRSYTELINSPRVADAVGRDLRIPITPSFFAGAVNASSAVDTVLIDVTVTTASAEKSVSIANAIGRAFPAVISQLETPPGSTTAPAVFAQLVQPATLPVEPVSPSLLLNISIGAALGLLMGLSAAVVRSLSDTTVREARDLREIFDSPVLGEIERDEGLGETPNFSGTAEYKRTSEQFRRIRTNLMFVDVDRPRHVFLVTSSVAAEGKTTVSCQLASSFAAAGHKTLLLDGDLRRPRVAEVFGVTSDVGLTNVLLGRLGSRESAQSVSRNLDVIAAGTIPPNPSELLTSRAMSKFLSEVREAYEVVIIDAPPLLPVADASIMTSLADISVLVVRAGSTTHKTIQAGEDAIKATGDNLGGLILTQTRPSTKSSSYYRSYQTSASEPVEAIDATTTVTHVPADVQNLRHSRPSPSRSPSRSPSPSPLIVEDDEGCQW